MLLTQVSHTTQLTSLHSLAWLTKGAIHWHPDVRLNLHRAEFWCAQLDFTQALHQGNVVPAWSRHPSQCNAWTAHIWWHWWPQPALLLAVTKIAHGHW